MTTSVDFRCLTISANEGVRYQDQETGDHRRKYTVRVKSDATGRTVRFVYHDSIWHEREGKRGLGPDDLMEAFRCFVGDVDFGGMSHRDFCEDMGYDVDSISARRIWRACYDARRRWSTLWASDVNPCDILNELSDMGVE